MNHQNTKKFPNLENQSQTKRRTIHSGDGNNKQKTTTIQRNNDENRRPYLHAEINNSNPRTSRERPKSASYLRLKNIQGTTIGKTWEKFFFKKKYLVKQKSHIASGLLNVFYKPKTSKNSRGYSLTEFKNFRKHVA